MLIEFSVKNFKSIKEKQTLSLVSSPGGEHRGTHTIPTLDSKLSLVRSSVVYGPNASGKTSLIRALATMKRIVLHSAQSQLGDKLPVIPYLFDQTTRHQPTEFFITFLHHHVRYEYGFTATDDRIWEEWLFAFPKGSPQTWISRTFNPTDGQYKWGNLENLRGAKQTWKNATLPNVLFLSRAIQLGSQQLQPVFDWFQNKLQIVLGDLLPEFTLASCGIEKERKKILNFLQEADFHIHDLELKVESIELEKFSANLLALQKETMEGLKTRGVKEITRYDLKLIHLGVQDELIQLDMNEESTGTQKFFSYAGPWLDVLQNGCVLVVDELSNNLHPKLVRYMVEMFHRSVSNPHNAQLIFTTHETSILNQDVFRRDQIWFTQKDKFNATILYPLTDFSPRKGVENLEKGYLLGRYGALPFLQEINVPLGGK